MQSAFPAPEPLGVVCGAFLELTPVYPFTSIPASSKLLSPYRWHLTTAPLTSPSAFGFSPNLF